MLHKPWNWYSRVRILEFNLANGFYVQVFLVCVLVLVVPQETIPDATVLLIDHDTDVLLGPDLLSQERFLKKALVRCGAPGITVSSASQRVCVAWLSCKLLVAST